ncbi:MAG: DNA repair protein RadC [Candidatus Kapabacteria bacterium]|nr:DNA repair protein RadC [Candidatus Kapabacteria bacterium]
MTSKNNNQTNNNETTFVSIRNWREDERPRERLVKHGSSVLSDSELLTILIGNGTRNFSAYDAARALLDKYKSLDRLVNADLSEFRSIPGIGFAKSIILSAAFELSKRIQSEPFDLKSIRSAEDIAQHYIPKLRPLKKEIFLVLLLNSSNKIIREEIVSEGILTSSLVHPREVFRCAITENAASVILLHNHPSGNPEPSKEDIIVTQNLKKAGDIIGIKVEDHIIIAGDSYFSMLSRGIL